MKSVRIKSKTKECKVFEPTNVFEQPKQECRGVTIIHDEGEKMNAISWYAPKNAGFRK